MNPPRKKFILPAIVIAIVVIVGVIIFQSVLLEGEPIVPMPLPQADNTSDRNITEISTLPLTISLSQTSNSNITLKSANITRGDTLTINVDLLLSTKRTEQ